MQGIIIIEALMVKLVNKMRPLQTKMHTEDIEGKEKARWCYYWEALDDGHQNFRARGCQVRVKVAKTNILSQKVN